MPFLMGAKQIKQNSNSVEVVNSSDSTQEKKIIPLIDFEALPKDIQLHFLANVRTTSLENSRISF
jgi:hypothetical protein